MYNRWLTKSFRRASVAALLIAGVVAAPALRAATAEDGAVLAARDWAKAVVERDVETQMNLLPKRLYASPEARERARQQRLHERELAVINQEKILAFDVQPPSATGKVGKLTLVILPYRAVIQNRDGKLERNSSLLAMAEEGSSEWAVMDGSGQNPKSLRFVVPGYNNNPRIPPSTSKLMQE